MKDVATDANVSQNTVSRILSGATPAVPISAVPALTTVRMPVDAMARAAVARAVPRAGAAPGPRVETFATELVVRASSGPVRAR